MKNHYKQEIRIDRHEVIESTRDFQERYLLNDKNHLTEKTRTHLYRGFGVRLLMIQHALVELDVELAKANGPIDSHVAIELTLLLNSLYLNLAGGLDNLAWAIAYQYELYSETAEESHERKEVVLVGKRFLKKLIPAAKDLSDSLKTFQVWHEDLRKFRDPGAHRIPLYVPPSTLSESDLEIRTRLDAEAAERYAAGDGYAGGSTMYEMSKLGEFYPIFTADMPQVQAYNLGPKVMEDVRQFFAIANIVYNKGLGLPSLHSKSEESFRDLFDKFENLAKENALAPRREKG